MPWYFWRRNWTLFGCFFCFRVFFHFWNCQNLLPILITLLFQKKNGEFLVGLFWFSSGLPLFHASEEFPGLLFWIFADKVFSPVLTQSKTPLFLPEKFNSFVILVLSTRKRGCNLFFSPIKKLLFCLRDKIELFVGGSSPRVLFCFPSLHKDLPSFDCLYVLVNSESSLLDQFQILRVVGYRFFAPIILLFWC